MTTIEALEAIEQHLEKIQRLAHNGQDAEELSQAQGHLGNILGEIRRALDLQKQLLARAREVQARHNAKKPAQTRASE